ncbi:MAG: helix-turn-helix domain-containing protein [Clostridia bacterium]|nr:helix-turn-helix domain-containing protein [Clostridia bacterium]
MNSHIAENLKALRKRFSLSQEEAAERVGVSRQAVAKWESGETVPDLMNCTALAELYSVTLDDLVHFSGGGVGADLPPKGKYLFGTVTVGERGQVVIPKRARDLFHIQPGDELLVLGDEAWETRGLALVDPKLFMAQMAEWKRTHRIPEDLK